MSRYFEFKMLLIMGWRYKVCVCVCRREEKSEQLLDCRQELENLEKELRRIQQEVKTLHGTL